MSKASHPLWSVQALVHEPLELLCAFVAHYLGMGASEVHLFLDRPDPEQVAVLRAKKGVRLTLCDDAFWAKTREGTRPVAASRRQRVVANRAYRNARFDWMLFCDADEFLHLDAGPSLAARLGALDPDVAFMRLPIAERCYTHGKTPQHLFDGVFRSALAADHPVLDVVYGPKRHFLTRGLTGHPLGKSIARRGCDLRISIHWPLPKAVDAAIPEQELLDSPAYQNFLPGAHLVHFDGLTPLHWMLKLIKLHESYRTPADVDVVADLGRRSEHRAALVRAAYLARQDADAQAALSPLQWLAPAALDQLRAAGGLVDLSIDPISAAKAAFPQQSLNFSIPHFDTRLLAINPTLAPMILA